MEDPCQRRYTSRAIPALPHLTDRGSWIRQHLNGAFKHFTSVGLRDLGPESSRELLPNISSASVGIYESGVRL